MEHERIHPAVYTELEAQIAEIDQDRSLADVTNFVPREESRRALDLRIIARIEELLDGADKGEKKRLRAVKRHALATRSRLEQLNERHFATFRQKIKQAEYTRAALSRMLHGYIEHDPRELWNDPPRYDHLDTFVDGLLQIAALPRPRRQPDPEMVYYQATPARIVLDLVDRLALSSQDVLYDLGSGLGRVVMTAALVSDARVIGVEFEPAYYEYAQRHAQALSLAQVSFVNADAREVRYADGTVFFLYTPFKGKILQRVLQLLHYEARSRRIRLCTYGPGTLDMLQQTWLRSVDDPEPTIHRAAIFESA